MPGGNAGRAQGDLLHLQWDMECISSTMQRSLLPFITKSFFYNWKKKQFRKSLINNNNCTTENSTFFLSGVVTCFEPVFHIKSKLVLDKNYTTSSIFNQLALYLAFIIFCSYFPKRKNFSNIISPCRIYMPATQRAPCLLDGGPS